MRGLTARLQLQFCVEPLQATQLGVQARPRIRTPVSVFGMGQPIQPCNERSCRQVKTGACDRAMGGDRIQIFESGFYFQRMFLLDGFALCHPDA